MSDAIAGGSRNLPGKDAAAGSTGAPSASSVKVGSESRAARRDDDIDPTRGQVLYWLTCQHYLADHGRRPRYVDLNRLFPASSAGPQKSDPWNSIARGDQLPRPAETPQGVLMRKLTAVYPSAAASYNWPIWPLSSWSPLSLPKVHGLMLRLPLEFSHRLIGTFPNGRCARYPTDPRDEVAFFARKQSLGAVTALIALMREAELKQDPLTHAEAYYTMLPLLPALDSAFGDADLGQRFAAYLKERFQSMEFILPGAYHSDPMTDSEIVPVRFRLPNRLDHDAALRLQAEWFGCSYEAFEESLKQPPNALGIWTIWTTKSGEGQGG